MKEWKTTVWDYMREWQGWKDSKLYVIVSAAVAIALLVGMYAITYQSDKVYEEKYQTAVALIDEGRYEEAVDVFSGMVEAGDRWENSIFPDVLFRTPEFSSFQDELDEMVNTMLRNGEYLRVYMLANGGIAWANDDVRQRVYLAYANERYAAGDYREAAEAYLLLKEITGTSGNLRSAAELYAEELRTAGDEAGAEEWLEYVEERRRGAE